MKNKFLVIALTIFSSGLIISCSNSEQKGDSRWEKREEAVKVSSLPSISFAEMKIIYEECDYIDFIFYTVDFSMSINNKTNIQKTVAFVSTNVARMNPSCKAMGRVFFQKNGELLVEADMYHDEQCHYFVFYKNGKPAYANQINPAGQTYFNNVFSQVKVEKK